MPLTTETLLAYSMGIIGTLLVLLIRSSSMSS